MTYASSNLYSIDCGWIDIVWWGFFSPEAAFLLPNPLNLAADLSRVLCVLCSVTSVALQQASAVKIQRTQPRHLSVHQSCLHTFTKILHHIVYDVTF